MDKPSPMAIVRYERDKNLSFFHKKICPHCGSSLKYKFIFFPYIFRHKSKCLQGDKCKKSIERMFFRESIQREKS